MARRDELLGALTARYGLASRVDKGRILTEFVAMTGYHRKHAARLLRGAGKADRSKPRSDRRLYDDAVREALIVLWEASDRICGKRLKPLIPMLIAAMERHGHLVLDPGMRERLEAISAATIDRILGPVRKQAGGRGRRRTAPSSAIRRAVPKPGHEPHNRRLADDPDEFRDHAPDVCERCGGGFASDVTRELIGEYAEIELPPVMPHVVRHRRFSCRCPHCGVKAKAPSPAVATTTPFGPRIHALAVCFKGFQALSYERPRGMFRDAFGLTSVRPSKPWSRLPTRHPPQPPTRHSSMHSLRASRSLGARLAKFAPRRSRNRPSSATAPYLTRWSP